jgi:AmiR/NasT family two-component response regulator
MVLVSWIFPGARGFVARSETVGPVTAREQPDVAFVGLGESSEHALEMIEQIVHEAACPVVALLQAPDPAFLVEAARRGIFAYIADDDPQGWQNSIEIVLRRFAELGDLKRAFERPTVIERAKGILMERHAVDEEGAFQLLRDHARSTQSTLVDAAQSVVDGTLKTTSDASSTTPGCSRNVGE